MSYPSISRHLEARRISLETASDAELAHAFVAAFRVLVQDCPLVLLDEPFASRERHQHDE